MAAPRDRVLVLDGLRGVAVLAVVSFHFFSLYSHAAPATPYPYAGTFEFFEPFHSGWTGVLLFFIISGFVIAKSLDGSRSALQFFAKRLDRLALPMVVISTITFVLLTGPLATPVIQERLINFLPSWTFTSPEFFTRLDPKVDYIDGSYWTLFSELRFYIVAAAMWFLLPRGVVVRALAALGIVGPVVTLLAEATGHPGIGTLTRAILVAGSMPLFASGAIYLEMFEARAKRVDHLALALLIPISFILPTIDAVAHEKLGVVVALTLCHAIFLLVASRARVAQIFAVAPLRYVGQSSYSLYLMHQAIGIGVISRIPHDWPLAAQMGAVAGLILAMIAASRLSYRYIERQRLFTGLLGRLGGAAKTQAAA